MNLPLDSLFIFERGSEPKKARKYELDRDAAYRSLMRMPEETAEAADPAGSGKEAI